MGVYYMAVCPKKKQYIDPGDINDLGIKWHSILHPRHPFGQVLIAAMTVSELWHGEEVFIIPDSTSQYEVAHEEYENITKKVIEWYNAFWGSEYREAHDSMFKLNYTGEP